MKCWNEIPIKNRQKINSEIQRVRGLVLFRYFKKILQENKKKRKENHPKDFLFKIIKNKIFTRICKYLHCMIVLFSSKLYQLHDNFHIFRRHLVIYHKQTYFVK